jgi:hypothetical protein
MRVKPIFSLMLSVALVGGALSLSSGWAGQGKARHASQSGMIPASTSYGLLGEMQSFDVMDIEKHDFSAIRENVPAEVLEYARTALQNDDRLEYGSPADGILRFSCAKEDCSKIRAEVTQGLNGPVVWETEATYQPNVLVNVHFMPDSKKFAKHIVQKLAMDYQKAMKPSPMKINIKEE